MNQEQYNIAVKVFKEFAPTQQVPTLESIQETLTDKQKKYIESHDGFLVLTPALDLYNIIQNFDDKQAKKTWIYHALWDQYKLGNDLRIDFVLPEVAFRNQTYEQQKKSLTKARKSLKGLQSIDPRTYIMAQAIRREQGTKLFNNSDWIRFIHLPFKMVGGDSWVGGARSVGDRPGLGRGVGEADPFVGVGLSVRLNTSDLEFSDSSSVSELDAIRLLKNNGYSIWKEY